jgi:muconolactone delta-isomerase
MMEFLVPFEVEIPDGVPQSEIEDRERAEGAAAESLADHGYLVRLWKASTETVQRQSLASIGPETRKNSRDFWLLYR